MAGITALWLWIDDAIPSTTDMADDYPGPHSYPEASAHGPSRWRLR
jgi:hypothetical protein